MTDEEVVGGSLSDDIVGVTTYEAGTSAKREFQPWHLPRKQYVRTAQWARDVKRLADKFADTEKSVRYLGLPGNDLLDLRLLHDEVCVGRDITLRFLGLNSAAQKGSPHHSALNVSLDEVRKLSHVDPLSNVLVDDIARLGNDTSVAWRAATAAGPFDVINLDLCDGFVSAAPGGPNGSTYEAMPSLLGLQARRSRPWLLFITTRVGEGHTHEEVADTLRRSFENNAARCKDFQAFCCDKLALLSDGNVSSDWKSPHGQYCVTICGLFMWLVGIAAAQSPPTRLRLKSLMGYRVKSTSVEPDICSLSIEFTPILAATRDPVGLARGVPVLVDECDAALQSAQSVHSRVDVDALLAKDAGLRTAMTDGTAALLTKARYDRARYIAWLSTQD